MPLRKGLTGLVSSRELGVAWSEGNSMKISLLLLGGGWGERNRLKKVRDRKA